MSQSDQRVRQILATAEIDGVNLRLTGQLDRKEYAEADKVLQALGGKWNRKARAHVFASEPGVLLTDYLGGGATPQPARTTEGFVRTPDVLAAEIVETYLGFVPGPRVLEPSAGDGSFVRAALSAHEGVHVTAVEPNAVRAGLILTDPRVTVCATTFEDFAVEATELFDVAVMNPPFSVPTNRTIWIDHVRLAWGLLAPGGRLVAIVPNGFGFREDKRHAAMRDLIAEYGGHETLPEDAFAGSGTGIRTVVLWADKVEETR
jgi:hypothetical protein